MAVIKSYMYLFAEPYMWLSKDPSREKHMSSYIFPQIIIHKLIFKSQLDNFVPSKFLLGFRNLFM